MARAMNALQAIPQTIAEDAEYEEEGPGLDEEPAAPSAAEIRAAEEALEQMERDLAALGSRERTERRRSSGGSSCTSESSAEGDNAAASGWGDDAFGRVLDRVDDDFSEAAAAAPKRRQTMSGPSAAQRRKRSGPSAAAPRPPLAPANENRGAEAARAAATAKASPAYDRDGVRAPGEGGEPRSPTSPVYDISSQPQMALSLVEARARMRRAHLKLAEVNNRPGYDDNFDCDFVCGVSHECAPTTATCSYGDPSYAATAGATDQPRADADAAAASGAADEDDADDGDFLSSLGICSVSTSPCTVM